jgi:hypothetical protein
MLSKNQKVDDWSLRSNIYEEKQGVLLLSSGFGVLIATDTWKISEQLIRLCKAWKKPPLTLLERNGKEWH